MLHHMLSEMPLTTSTQQHDMWMFPKIRGKIPYPHSEKCPGEAASVIHHQPIYHEALAKLEV